MHTNTLYQGQYHHKQDAELSHEARHILKTTVLDLDLFLALDAAGKAARWQQWPHGAKAQAVALMLVRRTGTWDDDAVAAGIAHYDARWLPRHTESEE